MKRSILILIVLLLMASVSHGALRTFTDVGDGLWSTAANWDTGVPVNGDTFLIPAGEICTLDKDNITDGVTLGASQIAATGTLICSTSTGAYSLSLSGDLNLDGTLQAGTSTSVPLPSDVTFTIDFTSTSSSIDVDDTTGSLLLYCQEPTTKYISTTAQEPATETVLAVDTDVTSDIWAAGDTICICDLIDPATGTRDNEEETINAIAAGTITLNAGLTNQKEIGSKVILISRNIRLINSTDYVVKNGKGLYVGAEVYNYTGGGYNSLDDSTIAGSFLMPSGEADYVLYLGSNNTIDAAFAQDGSSGTSFGMRLTDSTVVSGSIIAGLYACGTVCTNITVNGEIAATTFGFLSSRALALNGEFKGTRYPLSNCYAVVITGDMMNFNRALDTVDDARVSNCELGGSIGGVTSSRAFSDTVNAISCFNVLFSATSEFIGYNSPDTRAGWNYIESSDHDQTTNAFKAWCVGGIVTSQTASPPTGFDIWYEHACEDTTVTYPCYRQFETTVQPGASIEVSGKFRIADGEDLTGVGDIGPSLQIIDKFADPLVDSTQNPLDEDFAATIDGTELGWQDVDVIWANTGDAPRTVIVRAIAWCDGAGATDIDSVWSIADYKDQINETLKRVKRISAGSEF